MSGPNTYGAWNSVDTESGTPLSLISLAAAAASSDCAGLVDGLVGGAQLLLVEPLHPYRVAFDQRLQALLEWVFARFLVELGEVEVLVLQRMR